MNVICSNCTRETSGKGSCVHCGGEPALQGRYLLEEVVGQGSSGTTYRARDTEEERQVAVKEMGIHGIETFKAHELFEREAGVLCRLEHPGVPTFFDYFQWGEGKALRFYLVMEFVEGQTLVDELDRRHYTVDDARDVIWQLAEIARYLHGLSPPVIHRDIKPSNLLRRPDGELVLIDFGSVRDALEADGAGSTIAGTIGYMAPEQLRGEATPASDVYGIGATVVHLLTRRDPSELLGPTNRLEWREYVEMTPVFSRLMSKILAVDPGERISDGEALMKAVVDAGEKAEDWEAAPAWGGVPARRSRTITCAECGYDNEDDVEFCLGCGSDLSVSKSELDIQPIARRQTRARKDDGGKRASRRQGSKSVTASMITLLTVVAVMGIVCGGWLTFTTGSYDDGSVDDIEAQQTVELVESRAAEFERVDSAMGDFELDLSEFELPVDEEVRPGGAVRDAIAQRRREEVRDFIYDQRSRIDECAADAEDSDGELTLYVTVEAGGTVGGAEVIESDVEESVGACVLEIVEGLEFHGADVDVSARIPVPIGVWPEDEVDEEPEDENVQDSLSRNDVLWVMHSFQEDFQRCGDGSVDRSMLSVHFKVQESGEVSAVNISDRGASEELISCVRGVFDRMQFPRIRRSQPIQYPIRLE